MTNKEFEEYIQNNLVWVLHNVRVATGNIVEENRQLNKDYKREKTINKKLRERISKAIKMLEESQKGLEEWHFDGYDPCLEDIIKILKGEDNE